jgi:hypothetical protein
MSSKSKKPSKGASTRKRRTATKPEPPQHWALDSYVNWLRMRLKLIEEVLFARSMSLQHKNTADATRCLAATAQECGGVLDQIEKHYGHLKAAVGGGR